MHGSEKYFLRLYTKDDFLLVIDPFVELLFCYNAFTMSIWQRILYWIGLRSDPGPRFYEFSESMQTTLSTLAEFEGQPEDEFAQTLLSSGLDQYYAQEEILQALGYPDNA